MKNLLICVTGLTPQVVTEALFCLSYKQKIKIDELYAITTSRGRDVILGHDSKVTLPPLKKEIQRMCQKYKLNVPKFEYNDNHIIVAKEQSIELSDVRDDKHNKLFPNKVCGFLNDKTRNRENILYCLISGGRKSMGVDLAQALSIFGRENDKLLHVLTHEDNEFKGFFPETKSQINDLELAELPFVKLRSIIGRETKNKSFTKMSFTDIVKFTQAELRTAFSDKAQIDISDNGSNEIAIGEYDPVKLQPSMMALYRFILINKMEGNDYVSFRTIADKCGHKFTKDTLYQTVSKIRRCFEKVIDEPGIIGLYIIQGPDVFGKSNYGIIADRTKFKVNGI